MYVARLDSPTLLSASCADCSLPLAAVLQQEVYNGVGHGGR